MECVAVYFSFPRSGGTLLNQCLGCDDRNVILSEVNPLGSVIAPEQQAAEWFQLVSAEEAAALARRPYAERIRRLNAIAGARGRRLIVRDWCSINFLSGVARKYFTPTMRLEQRAVLADAGMEIHGVVLARRAPATFLSMRRSLRAFRTLELDDFADRYLAYARAVQGLPVFHLEELTRAPEAVLQRLCAALGAYYPEDFLTRFAVYTRCTGNIRLGTGPASARWKTIEHTRSASRTPEWVAAAAHPAIREADALLGYDPTGELAGCITQ